MSLWINGEWRPGRGPGFSKQDPVNLKVVVAGRMRRMPGRLLRRWRAARAGVPGLGAAAVCRPSGDR